MSTYQKAITEARETLVRRARAGSLVTYSEVAEEIKAMPLEPDSTVLANILDEISSASYEERGCMLSAVVIHKGGDGLPGNGFYSLAASLGRTVGDRFEFHVSEIERVHVAYRR